MGTHEIRKYLGLALACAILIVGCGDDDDSNTQDSSMSGDASEADATVEAATDAQSSDAAQSDAGQACPGEPELFGPPHVGTTGEQMEKIAAYCSSMPYDYCLIELGLPRGYTARLSTQGEVEAIWPHLTWYLQCMTAWLGPEGHNGTDHYPFQPFITILRDDSVVGYASSATDDDLTDWLADGEAVSPLGDPETDLANTYWFDERGAFAWGGEKSEPGYTEHCLYCADKDMCDVSESVGCSPTGTWADHEENVFGPEM